MIPQELCTALDGKFSDALASPALTTPSTSAAKASKTSPNTGAKPPKPSKPARPDSLEMQLRAMQQQLEEQGAKLAEYDRQAKMKQQPKQPKKPVDPMELKLQQMQKLLDQQGAMLQAYKDKESENNKAENPAAKTPSPAPASKTPGSKKAQPPPEEATQDDQDEETGGEPIVMPDGSVVISHDAIRMRLKRLCTKKKTGRAWVSDDMLKEYEAGGASRESLEMALVETIRELGTKVSHQKMRVP